ncbi:Hypothetical predicted protein [Pelobates cultripes]|uniref:Uncharacterized protein n=1 Tax=Pelobates cultripes TaxID=61616 RepID=A0AAD1TGP0_PELCU|nr:Hypothetical predicted protein [Pelobates cultripes]
MAHRAVRPKGLSQDAPRNIICRVHHYSEKENIMRHARDSVALMYNTTKLQLLPNLPWMTLRGRRALRPLTQALQQEGIKYQWGYPFSLIASHQGTQATVTTIANLKGIYLIPYQTAPNWQMNTKTRGEINAHRPEYSPVLQHPFQPWPRQLTHDQGELTTHIHQGTRPGHISDVTPATRWGICSGTNLAQPRTTS